MSTLIQELRSKHRSQRRALSEDTLAGHAVLLEKQLSGLPEFKAATHIAAYIAILGEISLEPVIRAGSEIGKIFYLPILRGSEMAFAPWHPDTPLVKKKFNLLEPDCDESSWVDPTTLDLVLSPLVVFDEHCNRIGQGGGYYDKTFEFTLKANKPLLVGVAHESQREPKLDPQPWDITLDKIVTEKAIYTAK